MTRDALTNGPTSAENAGPGQKSPVPDKEYKQKRKPKLFKHCPIGRIESSEVQLLNSSLSEEISPCLLNSAKFPPLSPAPMSATSANSATALLPYSPTNISPPFRISSIGEPGSKIDAKSFPLIDDISANPENGDYKSGPPSLLFINGPSSTKSSSDILLTVDNSIDSDVLNRGVSSDYLLSNSGSIASLSMSGKNPTETGHFAKEDSGIRTNSTTSFAIVSSPSATTMPEVLLNHCLVEKDTSTRNIKLICNNPTVTSCTTTITTSTSTTCSNGSTPGRTRVSRKQRIRLRREICLTLLVGLLSILTSCFLALYLRVLYWTTIEEPLPEICSTPDCLRAASRLLDRMDRTVSPCEDFYQFSCGNYLQKNVVPDDAPYRSAMQEMQEDVLVIIRKMLSGTPAANESEAIGRARRLYHSCMNTSFTVHEKDMADSPIFNLLSEEHLGPWAILTGHESWDDSLYDLERLLAQLTLYQVHTFFDSYITPDEKNSSVYTLQFYKGSPALARNYYLNTSSEEYVGYMSAYKVLMEEVVAALAGTSSFNTSEVEELIAFETKFAMITDSRGCDSVDASNLTESLNASVDDEEESVGRMTVADLDALSPEIKWSRMLEITLGQYDDLNLEVKNLMVTLHCTSYVPELVSLLAETPKRVVANYLLWRFLLKYLPYISNYFQQLWQQFRIEVPDPFEERTYLSRWKECAAVVNEGFGAALASMYVEKYYDTRTSIEIDFMVEEVRSAFNRVIQRQNWLEEDMKGVCHDKLYLMGKKIGYPEYIESVQLLNAEFEGLDILEDHFLNNILRMKKHEVGKELKRLSRPVDKKKDWLIQPLIVNAFHNPTANEIILPLGILREPFYHPGYPMYLNYGSLGVVVGHELVHGFDNHGKKYDKHGNVSQWWSENMVEQFMERAACFVDQYSQFPIEMVGKNVDGNDTLGDNICDNTGLLNAWLAYENWRKHNGPEPLLPGLTNYTIEQIFFITFGQIWCEVVGKEGYEKYSTDMHSPGIHRTNGVAQNSEFFSNTWNCPIGSSMNPEKKCKLWV